MMILVFSDLATFDIEIHVDTERISKVDQKHLSSFVLGPADCSEACRDTVETMAKNDGL